MPAITRLKLSQFIPKDGCFHLARVLYRHGQTCRVHRHDFCEIFWIEQGQAMHIINGKEQQLAPGTLTWIRPNDAHGFEAKHPDGFTMANLAFDASVMTAFLQRYADNAFVNQFNGDEFPGQVHLQPTECEQLTQAVDQLAMYRQSRLDLEWFVVNLLHLIEHASLPMSSDITAPSWLQEALSNYLNHAAYQQGPVYLAQLANRSIEHLNRTVRQCYGQSTTHLIVELRLQHAARCLTMTDTSIMDIAMDSGFDNLGYFYRCFQRQFKMTPRHYRLKMHAVAR
jgi:AraC family cel operon transcriptional repressor